MERRKVLRIFPMSTAMTSPKLFLALTAKCQEVPLQQRLNADELPASARAGMEPPVDRERQR